ncbi:MAG: multidrug effflux MFS transporter [Gammaproteobacteria bacterium]|nr:multidrug effflux MFS transporter [Gammaproteobacteria bacterium]
MSLSITPANQTIGMVEFIFLIASLMSMVALAIDAVLPALGFMATDFAVSTSQIQFILTGLFAGFALGQLLYGPLSDRIGRLPGIYAGMLVFAAGCGIVLTAESLEVAVLGRVLQGIGASGPRIIVTAIVRDCFEGRVMARVMSFATTVFMIVPIMAPMVGQVILWYAPWQYIFVMYIVLAALLSFWTWLRLNETLDPANQRSIHPKALWKALVSVLKNRVAAGYTVVSGMVFGGFLGYLSSSQVLFQGIYGVGDAFPLYFSLLILPNVVSSLLNARLVMRWGMYRLVQCSNIIVLVFSVCLYAYASTFDGVPPLMSMMAFFFVIFAGLGFQFGNLHALAMEPLGKLAGMGASVVGSGSTIISIPFGVVVGMSVTTTIIPLTLGLAGCSLAAVLIMHWVRFGFGRPRAGSR